MMSAKSATLNLFKIKLFQNKVYDVITSADDVTNTLNQITSRESSYITDVVISPKFGNFNYFIISILQAFDRKKPIF